MERFSKKSSLKWYDQYIEEVKRFTITKIEDQPNYPDLNCKKYSIYFYFVISQQNLYFCFIYYNQ
jgi:hypothetical protein